MKIIDIKDNQPVIDPSILTIKEFEVLWQRDKSKDKSRAFKELAFIYHYYDGASPYANWPRTEKLSAIVTDIVRDDKWKPDAAIEAAGKKYVALTETDKQRYVKVVYAKLEEMSEFLRKTPVTLDTEQAIRNMIKNMATTIADVEKFEDAVVREKEKGKGRIRGDKDVALFED